VHAEALSVMVAVRADFVFNRWDLEILPYYRVRQIPLRVRYQARSVRLEAFEYFYFGRGCGSPDWFHSMDLKSYAMIGVYVTNDTQC
jgi:hypothetical protein